MLPGFARSKQTFDEEIRARKSHRRIRKYSPTRERSPENASSSSKIDRRLPHGDAPYGAGQIAASKYGGAEIVDPESSAVGSLQRFFQEYDHLDALLPAMGYSDVQIRDLEATIRNAAPDVMVSWTPLDLTRLVNVNVPVARGLYELEEINLTLDSVLDRYADVLDLNE